LQSSTSATSHQDQASSSTCHNQTPRQHQHLPARGGNGKQADGGTGIPVSPSGAAEILLGKLFGTPSRGARTWYRPLGDAALGLYWRKPNADRPYRQSKGSADYCCEALLDRMQQLPYSAVGAPKSNRSSVSGVGKDAVRPLPQRALDHPIDRRSDAAFREGPVADLDFDGSTACLFMTYSPTSSGSGRTVYPCAFSYRTRGSTSSASSHRASAVAVTSLTYPVRMVRLTC
jgi:hypothetical protein